MSKKIVLGFFKICKYAFLNIWKRLWAKKLFQVFLKFVNILFLIFQKGYKQKIVLGFFLDL